MKKINKIKFQKKSQFFILSGLLLFLLIFFIYSIETQNSYIVKTSKFNLLDNIIYETCEIAKISNGTNINGRLTSFANNVSSYCLDLDYSCQLTITNNTEIPPEGNWSLLNYTHYNYNINYQVSGFVYSSNFTC